MSLLTTLQELANSIIAYFGAFNWEEVLTSVKLVIDNFDIETFKTTLETLKDFISGIAAMIG